MTKQWVKNAPEYLVRAYQGREFGNNGRIFFERLLCDERMRTVWKELARYSRTDKQWLDVWQAIASAKFNSNRTRKRKRRSDERDDFKKLAQKFAALSKKIKNGPLDVLAYHLLPQDVWAALHVENFHDMDSLQRSAVAHRLLPSWPMASELLRGLEMLALAHADHVMNMPRPDERDSGNVAARTFVWYLGQNFRAMFGKPMLGSLAKITNVIFDSDDEFSRNFVQNVLRGV